MDYDYESIDSGIKKKIITEIEAEIKKDNSKFFEEQPPIRIKEKNWKKEKKKNARGEYEYEDIPFADGVKTIIDEICNAAKIEKDKNGEEIFKLSRSDVFGESDTKKKIIKVLMWGYPRAKIHRSMTYIINITNAIETLSELFGNLAERGINEIWQIMNGVSGLGIATMSKLLYFFEVSFEGKRCLIYDSKVRRFLNHDEKKLTLCEDCYGKYLILNSDSREKLKDLVIKAWEDTDDCYFKYLGLMNDLMLQLKTDSENDLKIKEKIQGKSDKEIEEQIEIYMFTKGKAL